VILEIGGLRLDADVQKDSPDGVGRRLL